MREYSNSISYFPEQLRIGSDLMYLECLIDDQTDVEPLPVVRELVDIMIDALHNPDKPRPEGEPVLGRIVKESVIVFHSNALAISSLMSSSICRFCQRAFKVATTSAARHFVESFTEYLESNVVHSRDRTNNVISPFEGFIEYRRPNTSAKSMFFMGELGLNIPDEAYYHPIIREIQNCAIDLIAIDNVSCIIILPVTRGTVLLSSFIQDMQSYNIEQAVGEVHRNMLTVLMRQFNLDPQEAMNRTHECLREIQRKFIGLLGEVPSFGLAVDTAISDYIFHLGCWIQANVCWGFESGRYFGNKGVNVQRDGWVEVFPKVKTYPELDRELGYSS